MPTTATVKAPLVQSPGKDDRLVFETGAGSLDIQGAVTARHGPECPVPARDGAGGHLGRKQVQLHRYRA